MLFLAFAGEEIGLLGSSHWVNHPTLPLDKAIAMINMDMIGRIRKSRVYVGGVGTGSTFGSLLEAASKNHRFRIDPAQTGLQLERPHGVSSVSAFLSCFSFLVCTPTTTNRPIPGRRLEAPTPRTLWT